jgi:hypothetical protein
MEQKTKENTVWMSQKEAQVHSEWMEILEQEHWETGGEGYEKSGIVSSNRIKKENFIKHYSNV